MGKPIRDVMLLGGGRIAYYLAQHLAKLNIRTRIVEIDEARAQELSVLLPNSTIIAADCTSSEILEDEGLAEMDACIALTGNDEENVIVSMFAKTQGVERIITLVDRLSFVKMLPRIGVDCTVSPRQLSVAAVLRYLRGLENSLRRDVESAGPVGIKSLYKLCEGRAEALEFNVDESFRRIGIPLMSPEFRLKPNTLIASIVRGGQVIYPHGISTLEVGDSVVVVTTNPQLSTLNDILD
jgi:trk system potassium uptake protein TrkA